MNINIEEYEIFIKPGSTDLRKYSPSLAVLVQSEMKINPFGKKIFAFCNSSRDVFRAIMWDGTGWLELTKRLSCGKGFKWPNSLEEAQKVDLNQILMMLEGKDPFRKFEPYYPKYAY